MSAIHQVAIAAKIASAGPPATNLIAHWKLNTGLTQAGGYASAWADQINSYSLAQATGSAQPAVQGDGSLLFDGSDDWMKATFTLAQPCTVFLLVKMVTWAQDYFICDGASTNTGVIYEGGSTPQIKLFNSGFGSNCTDLAVNTWGVVCAVWDGASSLLQVDANATVAGSSGTTAMDGFTLSARADGAGGSNTQVKEVLIYNAALDATARGNVRTYLATV